MSESPLTEQDRKIISQLKAPGAGIPRLHRLFLTLWVKPWVVRRVAWDQAERNFTRVHEKLKARLVEFPKERLTQRVLVPPQSGLEDSSRYWSVAMTCRHLEIVGREIEKVILLLSQGKKPSRQADTAAVKPEYEKNAVESVDAYCVFGDQFLLTLQREVGDRSSRATHRHPWFGSMTAKDWLWLMATHTGIHLRQIDHIRQGL